MLSKCRICTLAKENKEGGYMGYHDVAPEAFIFSVALQETNSAEDANDFQKWLDNCRKKVRAFSEENALTDTSKSLADNQQKIKR